MTVPQRIFIRTTVFCFLAALSVSCGLSEKDPALLLSTAIKNKDKAEVTRLLAQGVPVNTNPGAGRTPPILAVMPNAGGRTDTSLDKRTA